MTDHAAALRVIEEVEIGVPPERVFRALTDPTEIPRWWGTADYRTMSAEIDLRPGGSYRLTGDSARLGTFEVTGVYRAVEPPARLVFTWTPSWDEGARDSVVDITIGAVAGGSRVRVVHTAFSTETARDAHAGGWPDVLGALRRYTAEE